MGSCCQKLCWPATLCPDGKSCSSLIGATIVGSMQFAGEDTTYGLFAVMPTCIPALYDTSVENDTMSKKIVLTTRYPHQRLRGKLALNGRKKEAYVANTFSPYLPSELPVCV